MCGGLIFASAGSHCSGVDLTVPLITLITLLSCVSILFDYESIDDSLANEEENFRVEFFLVLVDQTLEKKRFSRISEKNI